MKIYLCSPMFEEADIQYNLYLADLLRKNKFEVYCPNENFTINDKSQVGITPEMIYHTDIDEMLLCNVLLCRISNDAGVMWEAGFMDCLSKYFPNKFYGCIGLTTDIRWKTQPNPQLSNIDNQAYYFNGFAIGGLKESLGVYFTIEDLITRLAELRKDIEKER